MTATDVVLFLALGLALVASWMALLVFVPSYCRSLFRYRLWRIRDAVLDDLDNGALVDSPLVRRLVGTVEALIRNSDDITLLQFGCAPRPSEHARRVISRFIRLNTRRMSEQDRRRLEEHMFELRCTLTRHMFLGTRSGWAALPFVALIAAIVATVKLMQRGHMSANELARSAGGYVSSIFVQEERLIAYERRSPRRARPFGSGSAPVETERLASFAG